MTTQVVFVTHCPIRSRLQGDQPWCHLEVHKNTRQVFKKQSREAMTSKQVCYNQYVQKKLSRKFSTRILPKNVYHLLSRTKDLSVTERQTNKWMDRQMMEKCSLYVTRKNIVLQGFSNVCRHFFSLIFCMYFRDIKTQGLVQLAYSPSLCPPGWHHCICEFVSLRLSLSVLWRIYRTWHVPDVCLAVLALSSKLQW